MHKAHRTEHQQQPAMVYKRNLTDRSGEIFVSGLSSVTHSTDLVEQLLGARAPNHTGVQ